MLGGEVMGIRAMAGVVMGCEGYEGYSREGR